MTQNQPPSAVPFSQDDTKLIEGSRDAIIADIRRLVEAEPDRVIGRNYYRVHGRYAESAWSAHFGTWSEAKKQANITPSRHVQNHEKHIAKHASVERYRAMTDEKRGWEDAYLRPDARRFKTHLIITDVHDFDCDPFVRRVFMETAKRVQPSRVIIGGDLFDLAEFGKYAVDPREFEVVERIKWVHGFLAELREAAPEAQIDMVEGNHEHRLLRHLSEATPAMRAVLSDLHGFTVPKLLGLDAYEVNYVARADLATFNQRDITEELKRNYLIVDDAFIVHHFPEGRDLGFPGVNGHHHKHVVTPSYSPQFGSYTWQQLGCGHVRRASYCAGEKWSNGFMLAHVDTAKKHTQFEYCDLTFEHAVVGGRWYSRMSSEQLG
jgi:hypothetical protein